MPRGIYKRTAKAIAAMTLANRKPSHRRRMSRSLRKSWEDPLKRANRIKGIKAAWDDPKVKAARLKINTSSEVRAKISKTLKGRDPIGRPRGPRVVWYFSEDFERVIPMRSKDEVHYAEELDAKGIEWLYLPETKTFVEIKGWLLPWVKKKIEAVVTHFSATKFELVRV
jgi:hypothetical protein